MQYMKVLAIRTALDWKFYCRLLLDITMLLFPGTLTVNVLDYNDNPPEFLNPDISFSVAEATNGTVIGAVSLIYSTMAKFCSIYMGP